MQPQRNLYSLITSALICALVSTGAPTKTHAATSITQYGITWSFDKDYKTGTFINGDHWVVGPVTVVNITNSLNSKEFTPKLGQNGSMVNPGAGPVQGYDSGYQHRGKGYKAELNAALPNGKPLSADNPLILKPNQSLVSAVSWLFNSKTDREPGCPKIHITKVPLPALRSAAILTSLAKAPAPNSFRPAYCGDDKTVRFTKESLQLSLLKNLAPVNKTPNAATIKKLEAAMTRPWLDHYPSWVGRSFHPSENMPNYGRDFTKIMASCALLLQVDFDKIEGHPTKEKLLINLVQYGIDLTGIADSGGGWPPDGGHGMGRKLPILFAGVLLDDPHMKNVGKWKTMFQEDAQTFYVDKAAVEITNGPKWNPDRRTEVTPYSDADIGTPEWGIRHATDPRRDNKNWFAKYRAINNSVIPSFALVARIMGQKEAWNHDALFDYADRVMKKDRGQRKGFGTNSLPPFSVEMWKQYRAQF